jgi:DNA invertase Pin-like site-specific DNA recombinase
MESFTLISVAEPDLMASDPTRILMRQLMGAVAQYDKSQIVLKLRGARMRKRAAGDRCEGRKPFGRNEAERAAVERMKVLRADGLGFDRIAKRLKAEGVPTRIHPCLPVRPEGAPELFSQRSFSSWS